MQHNSGCQVLHIAASILKNILTVNLFIPSPSRLIHSINRFEKKNPVLKNKVVTVAGGITLLQLSGFELVGASFEIKTVDTM